MLLILKTQARANVTCLGSPSIHGEVNISYEKEEEEGGGEERKKDIEGQKKYEKEREGYVRRQVAVVSSSLGSREETLFVIVNHLALLRPRWLHQIAFGRRQRNHTRDYTRV